MSLIPAHLQRVQMDEPVAIGRFYPVQASDGFFMLCAVSDKNLQGLAKAICRPDLETDPRFIRGPRTENFHQLAKEVEKWSIGRSAAECESVLNSHGVPCASYQKPEELFSHPQVVERESFTRLNNDALGSFLIQNMPVRFDRTDSKAQSWVARLGEHTDEVLSSLGMRVDEIEALKQKGAVA